MINCLQGALSANLDHQSFYFISLHYAYGNRGDLEGACAPPPPPPPPPPKIRKAYVIQR